ncbi:DegT/DnrJ/EryC1/StrS family aminotransferase [Vibrio sp. Isolate34]|uniref:DegT/DnrJ/EryC1/StrS family aminotransferase n=1 Tax=Vibrio sp. Isolate34 TaxID=2908540 RepID=UPI001EFC4A5B|nr:DegT/DnrJ/EryC1/StrS family aminotransferase [Vibrio sp. Isolate34]MCG9639521.1 DegT/DnrJ/EryC1/StrS family aminotransferase [Vibrio sp. Isolate34]
MKNITVTTPLLPPLSELTPLLEDIWDKKWLTNNGHYHNQLEARLCEYLGVDYLSLFSNGTLGLCAALTVLELEGEVITTPYSFIATSNSILLSGLKPVFIDIDPYTFNLKPELIEAAITDKTTAIMPVHVYGNPCDHEKIQSIADKYGLKVIYDAAHAFAVQESNKSVLTYGDMSILSFHATKTYSTVEGGAVVCNSSELKEKLEQYKSFGFESEASLSLIGSNAKLNEVQSAFGLINLNYIDSAIEQRKIAAESYDEKLSDLDGLTVWKPNKNVVHNYSYYPILIDEKEFGISRDELFNKLKNNNIFARKYFYPLIPDFNGFCSDKYRIVGDLKNASIVASSVLCLPLHHEITQDNILFISSIIRDCKR